MFYSTLQVWRLFAQAEPARLPAGRGPGAGHLLPAVQQHRISHPEGLQAHLRPDGAEPQPQLPQAAVPGLEQLPAGDGRLPARPGRRVPIPDAPGHFLVRARHGERTQDAGGGMQKASLSFSSILHFLTPSCTTRLSEKNTRNPSRTSDQSTPFIPCVRHRIPL